MRASIPIDACLELTSCVHRYPIDAVPGAQVVRASIPHRCGAWSSGCQRIGTELAQLLGDPLGRPLHLAAQLFARSDRTASAGPRCRWRPPRAPLRPRIGAATQRTSARYSPRSSATPSLRTILSGLQQSLPVGRRGPVISCLTGLEHGSTSSARQRRPSPCRARSSGRAAECRRGTRCRTAGPTRPCRRRAPRRRRATARCTDSRTSCISSTRWRCTRSRTLTRPRIWWARDRILPLGR